MFNKNQSQPTTIAEGQSHFYSRDNLPPHGRVCVVGLMSCAALVVAYQDKNGSERIYISHLPSGVVSFGNGKFIEELKTIVSESNGSEIKAVYWSGSPIKALQKEIDQIDDILSCKTIFPTSKASIAVVDFNLFTVTNGADKYSLSGNRSTLVNKS